MFIEIKAVKLTFRYSKFFSSLYIPMKMKKKVDEMNKKASREVG